MTNWHTFAAFVATQQVNKQVININSHLVHRKSPTDQSSFEFHMFCSTEERCHRCAAVDVVNQPQYIKAPELSPAGVILCQSGVRAKSFVKWAFLLSRLRAPSTCARSSHSSINRLSLSLVSAFARKPNYYYAQNLASV